MQLLSKIVLSKKFLPAVFLFFALQAAIYASFVGFGIPSDENYHFGTVEYYAQQSIATGPFTHGQTPDTIAIVRTIDRDTDYLSHYLLSLPLRAMESLDMSFKSEVITLRLINMVFAVLGLFMLKKCLDEISDEKLVKNLTIFAMTMTGMAAWLAGSISYDNLANLLFLSFIWVNIKLIKKPEAKLFLAATLLSMATMITKHTFAPVLLIGLVLCAGTAWQKGFRPIIFWQQLGRSLKNGSFLAGLLILLNILFLGLFIERIGVNLVQYHAVQPSCDRLFAVEDCRTNNVYNRNFKQLQIYSAQDKTDLINGFEPFSYSGYWFYTMYNTLYFQLGDRRFESELYNRVFAAISIVALIVTAILSRRRIRLSKAAGYVLVISLLYLGLVFLRNLDTYISFGEKYAVQGRYLLPVLGFIYFFAILWIINTYKTRSAKYKTGFAIAWIVVAALFFATHFPPYLLVHGTDASWRENFILPKEVVD